MRTNLLLCLLLATSSLAVLPSTRAHVCGQVGGGSCMLECADDGEIHVHFGNWLGPCLSVPERSALRVATLGHDALP